MICLYVYFNKSTCIEFFFSFLKIGDFVEKYWNVDWENKPICFYKKRSFICIFIMLYQKNTSHALEYVPFVWTIQYTKSTTSSSEVCADWSVERWILSLPKFIGVKATWNWSHRALFVPAVKVAAFPFFQGI